MKNEFIMKEMFKMIEESERLSETMVIKDLYDNPQMSSISRLVSLEAQLEEQIIVYDV